MEQSQKERRTEVHYNRPQLRSMAVLAQHERAVWGRGTGKSAGLIAPRLAHNVFSMPRSLGALEARSFQQILTRTLPPVIRGLEMLGYKMGRDYTVRERGPKAWRLPLMPPLKWDMAMHFRNGSAMALVSQQLPGSANGLSIDHLIADEAKYLKKDQHDEEVLPAMRGNNDRFGHLSCHQSTLLCTDMPTAPRQRWILEEEKLMDQDAVRAILATQAQAWKLRKAIMDGGLAASSEKAYHSRIARLEAELNVLRKGTLYFSEASALDNIEVLGEAYIARMKQILPDYLFRTSILNLRPDRIEGGFYPNIDEIETYVAPDASFITGANIDLATLETQDCRKDGMLVPSLPLYAAPDFGSSFNCMVIGQLVAMDLNVDNQVYVKHPGKIVDLAKLFADYYKHHPTKHINLGYDHTMIGEDAVRKHGFILELKRELEAHDWTVTLIYVGQAPSHHTKYVFMYRRIGNMEEETPFPRLRVNEENCEPTLQSCRLAGAKQTKSGFEKDKNPEKDDNVDQAEATHLSDAFDLLLLTINHVVSRMDREPTGVIFG